MSSSASASARPMAPLRIAHVVDYLMPTLGYQEFLLPKWNARNGHEVHIFTCDRYTPLAGYAETWEPLLGPRICGTGDEVIEGVTVHRLPCAWELSGRPWVRGLEEELERFAPDVLFCHGSASPNSFRSARFAGRRNAPLFMDNHMTFSSKNRSLPGRLYYGLLRASTSRVLVPNVDCFYGVAEECSDFLEQEQQIPRQKIELLPLGLDTDLFQPAASEAMELRAKHGIPADARVVLQTGKLTQDKRPDLLAEALGALMGREEDLWLVYFGGGPEEMVERIRAPLIEHGAVERLRIVPFVPVRELSAAYSMASLCVYPEAASLSALEAAACERAVIMTDMPASQWRAECGVGVTYPTGDVGALRARIDELLSDPQALDVRGRQARQAVIEHFSYERIARQAEEAMHAALARRAA